MSNSKGFSLIELMIVVAIIGILSAIAVPNFQRFQAKAKQSEVKGNLSAYYQAATTSFAELGYFSGNFVAIGFNPDGELNYRISVMDGRDPPVGYPNENVCVRTHFACNGFSGGRNWTERPITSSTGPAGGAGYEFTSDTTFVALGAGRIGDTTIDRWAIQENKVFTILSNGMP